MPAPTSPSRPRSWRRARIALGASLALALGVMALANAHVLRGSAGRLHPLAATPPRRVAIVLGARVYPDGRPSIVLEDRLAAALELYRAGRVQRVLVSGDHRTEHYDETTTMARWLVARGVPAAHVFTDHAGLRTLDTMERAAKVFLVRDAVVCTQRFHLARSVWLARRAGIDAVGVEADRRVYRLAARDAVREFVARAGAVLDAYVLGTSARHLGPAIPIDGDAAASRDPSVPL